MLELSYRLHALAQRWRLVDLMLRRETIGVIRRRREIAGRRIGQARPRRLASERREVFLLHSVEAEDVFFGARIDRRALLGRSRRRDCRSSPSDIELVRTQRAIRVRRGVILAYHRLVVVL